MVLKFKNKIPFHFFLLIPLFLFVSIAAAEDKSSDWFIDGVEAFEKKDYSASLKLFEKAMDENPDELKYQFWFACNYKALDKPDEAATIFSALLRDDCKKWYEAFFELNDIYMKTKAYDKAQKNLLNAEQCNPDHYRLFICMGQLDIVNGRYDAAIENFETAVKKDNKVFQEASYYKGLAMFYAKNYLMAVTYLDYALKKGEDRHITDLALQLKIRIQDLEKEEKRLHMVASFSLGYDDNISNDPLDPPDFIAKSASEEADAFTRLTWHTLYDITGNNANKISAGFSADYLVYSDSKNDDYMGIAPMLRFSRKVKQYSFESSVSSGNYYEDNDDKLKLLRFSSGISIHWPSSVMTQFFLDYSVKKYQDNGETPDTKNSMINVNQIYPISGKNILLNLGGTFGVDDAEDDSSSRSYFELNTGIVAGLFADYVTKFSAAFNRSDYKEYIGSGDRTDNGFLVNFSIEKPVTKRIKGIVAYIYANNDSNVESKFYDNFDPYEYRKNVIQMSIVATL